MVDEGKKDGKAAPIVADPYSLGHLIQPLYDEATTLGCEVHPVREWVRWHHSDEEHELPPRGWSASFSFVFRGLPCVVEAASKPKSSGGVVPPWTTLAVLTSPRPGSSHPHTNGVEDWQSSLLPGELVCGSTSAAALRGAGFLRASRSWVASISAPLSVYLEAFAAIPWRVFRSTDLPDGLYADASCPTSFFDEFACWDERTVHSSFFGTKAEFKYGARTVCVTSRFGGAPTIRSWSGPKEPKTGHANPPPDAELERLARWACGRERALLQDLPLFFQ